MTTFFEVYRRAQLVEKCLPDMPIEDQYKEFWKLDAAMRKAFTGYLEQYEQGLIHSMELVKCLMSEVHKHREEL